MKHAWFRCAGATFVADASGALVWPDHELLVVADLHLEKGSSLARRGALLPPYDTRTTITRLERVLGRWTPRRVISLGDGFHDAEGSLRLSTEDRERLGGLVDACSWWWLTGNHDPTPPEGLGGRTLSAVEMAGITFCHMPNDAGGMNEVAGHLHPTASVRARGRRLVRPCFVADQHRVILPAFGSYTGGVNVLDGDVASLCSDQLSAYLLGRDGVHVIARHRLER